MKTNKGSAEGAVVAISGVILLIIIALIGIGIFGWHRNTGSGEHVGYITAVEKTGLIFKTGTVYVKTDIQSSQEDAYCIVDDQLASQLRELAENKSKVSISYFKWISPGITNCDGEPAIISGVREIE